MSVKASDQHTRLENAAFRKRLDTLGLGVTEDGAVEGGDKVVGGPDAVGIIAGDDRTLDPHEAAKLQRNVGFVGQLLGRDLTVSQSASNKVRSLSMEVTGFAATLRKADTFGDDTKKVMRRAKHFERSLRKALDGGTIGKADPDSVHSLADAVESLADASDGLHRRLVRQSEMLEQTTVESNGGFLGALGAGLATLAVAEASLQVRENLELLRPLDLVAHDLAAPASDGDPTRNQIDSIAYGRLSGAELDTITAVVERLEAKHTGHDRHHAAEALDGFFGKHFNKLSNPDAAGMIVRDHADLLGKSSDPRIKAGLAREDTGDLTAGEVFASALQSAAKEAGGDREALIEALGVGYYRS